MTTVAHDDSAQYISPAADRLKGIKAIAQFLGETERVTYTLLVRGIIPAGREGERWIASKQRLTEYHRQLCSGKRVEIGAAE